MINAHTTILDLLGFANLSGVGSQGDQGSSATPPGGGDSLVSQYEAQPGTLDMYQVNRDRGHGASLGTWLAVIGLSALGGALLFGYVQAWATKRG